jgi:hypothetical protein
MILRVRLAGKGDSIAVPGPVLIRSAGGDRDAVTVAMLIKEALRRAGVEPNPGNPVVAFLSDGSCVESSDLLVDLNDDWSKLEFSISTGAATMPGPRYE